MAVRCISSPSIWERTAGRDEAYVDQRLIVKITSSVASAVLSVLPGYVAAKAANDPVLSPVAGFFAAGVSFVVLMVLGRFTVKKCCLHLPVKASLVRQINQDLQDLTLEQFWNLYKLKTFDFSQKVEGVDLLQRLEDKFCEEYLERFTLHDLWDSQYFVLGGLGQPGSRLEKFREIRRDWENDLINNGEVPIGMIMRTHQPAFNQAKESAQKWQQGQGRKSRNASISAVNSVSVDGEGQSVELKELERPLLESDEENP